MAIFSRKARRLIDAAVADLADPNQAKVWQTWVRVNPEDREVGQSWQDTAGLLPFDVAIAAIYAVEHMLSWKRAQRETSLLSDDQLSDLDNDISHAKAIERFLVQAAARQVEPSRAAS